MTRGRVAVATALAGLVTVGLLPASAQEAAPVTGWWSHARVGAPSPVEAPVPFVPEGGTWVSGNDNGVLALSALRLELAEGDQATQLALEVADVQGTPQVTVCPAGVVWVPNTDGRRYDEAPVPDCAAGQATGTVEEGLLVVPLAGAVPAGTLDVVLLPAEGSAFSLSLQPATAESVTVTPAPAPFAPLPEAPVVVEPVTGDPVPTSVTPLPPLDLGTGTTTTPLLGAELPAAAPSAPAVEAPQAAAPRPLAARPAAAAPLDDRRTTVPALLLLFGLMALAVKLNGTPVRAPVALGGAARVRAGAAVVPAAPAPVRGVGRFRRERTGPPPAL